MWGLASGWFNRHQPEEQIRVLTDHRADLCFAPTDTAMAHLRREGIAEECIVRSRDVMADAARIFGEQAEAQASKLLATAGLQATEAGDQPFVLATIHRAENTDNPARLEAILTALAAVASNGAGGSEPLPVLLPLHPRTQARIEAH
jgi:UDP-GlcNAc3NAcA epimerase